MIYIIQAHFICDVAGLNHWLVKWKLWEHWVWVVVVVEGGEREDGDSSVVVEEDIVDDVYRGCIMNTWISLFGKCQGWT